MTEKIPITTKDQCYALLHRKALGNTLRMWPSWEAFHESGYSGPTGIRYRGKKGGSGPCVAQIPADMVGNVVCMLVKGGFDIDRMEFTQFPPDEYRTIQGELTENPCLYLHYSFFPAPMRLALAEDGRHATGLAAKMLLQRHLSPASMDDMRELLDLYPGHVVEFTAFSRNVGWARGRNAIVWEVRAY